MRNFCLVPFKRSESLTLKEAADIAGKSVNTISNWCDAYGIGRMIAGRYHVSRVALAMFLDGDGAALVSYCEGDRTSPRVTAYLGRYSDQASQ